MTTNSDRDIQKLLEINELFREHYYFLPLYRIPTVGLHHTQIKKIDRIVNTASKCIENRNYLGLKQLINHEQNRTNNDFILDAIAIIFDSASICLFLLGIDTDDDNEIKVIDDPTICSKVNITIRIESVTDNFSRYHIYHVYENNQYLGEMYHKGGIRKITGQTVDPDQQEILSAIAVAEQKYQPTW